MEKRVQSIVFRKLTYADFRHINKSGGEEEGGGGQSYIDFPTKQIPLTQWFEFLGAKTATGKDGPVWKISINSFGLDKKNRLKIYQRRTQSVCIASQKIHSRRSNRVPSWNPVNGFPDDYDHTQQNLVVYIAKFIDGQFWAGWFLADQVPALWVGNRALQDLFTKDAGFIEFSRGLFADTTNKQWPFHFGAIELTNEIPSDEDVDIELTSQDISPRLQQLIDSRSEPELVEKVMRIRKRSNKLIRNLKRLYKGRCQITGEKFTFKKPNGEFYSEVHHLIPLGEKGSDSYENTIVVSPLIHRMLHYANVSTIDLDKIVDNKLSITINGVAYVIEWDPRHKSEVDKALKG